MGRPKFIATDEQRSLVENLSAFGIQQDVIAQLVYMKGKPIALNTLRLHFKNELELGGTKANAKVLGSLYNSAIGGNIAAQIFWAKTRCGWHETPPPSRSDELILKGNLGTSLSTAVPNAVMAARVAKLSNDELDVLLKASLMLYAVEPDGDLP